MNAIKKIFVDTDHVLYRWHSNKDVFTYYRRIYPQVQIEDKSVVNSEEACEAFELYEKCRESLTSSNFTQNYSVLDEKFPQLLAYLEANWWPYHHSLISAWTNKYHHFGETSTSRVEGCHSKIKAWLNHSSRNNIYSFVTKLIP